MLQGVIMGPLGRTLGLIIVFAVFSLAAGSINGWYLQQAPAHVVDNERFDRLVAVGTHKTADDAWEVGTVLKQDAITAKADTCPKTEFETDLANSTAYYTPLGTKITTNATGAIPNCKRDLPGAIFGAGGLSGLVALILQAAGLGLPIGALIGLASFGASFVSKLGGSPIIAAIVMVIGFLLIGTLLNVLTPFVNDAFDSINGDRFLMYDEGIGTLSNVISNFFAVVLVGGLIYVAWSAIQQFRSAGTSSQSMFGGMSERKM